MTVYTCLECPKTFESESRLGFVRVPCGWYVTAEEGSCGKGILEFLCSEVCMAKHEAAAEASIAERKAWEEKRRKC